MAFWFHTNGRLSWNLITGAWLSTGRMLPSSLQYSAVLLVAATTLALSTRAPWVGRPMLLAGTNAVLSALHGMAAPACSDSRPRATAAVKAEKFILSPCSDLTRLAGAGLAAASEDSGAASGLVCPGFRAGFTAGFTAMRPGRTL